MRFLVETLNKAFPCGLAPQGRPQVANTVRPSRALPAIFGAADNVSSPMGMDQIKSVVPFAYRRKYYLIS